MLEWGPALPKEILFRSGRELNKLKAGVEVLACTPPARIEHTFSSGFRAVRVAVYSRLRVCSHEPSDVCSGLRVVRVIGSNL